MFFRRSLAALLLVAGMVVPALGQDVTVTLKWEFKKDVPFFQEMKTETKQTMKVMGMDVTQNQSQTFIFSWTPKEQDAATKNWTIIQKIEAVKMEIEIAGNKIPYDSTKDAGGSGNPLADFFKSLVGSEFKLTISPDMKVIKIEGKDDFITKLVKSNQQMEPILKGILSEEALKQMSDPAFAAIPGTPKKKGDSWDKKSTLNMGPIGSYDTTHKYTYEGKDDKKLDKIKVETSLTYQPPGANTVGSLPFKIKSAELKAKDATGTILFDNDKHRMESSNMTLNLVGKLTIDIGGMTSEVELNQQQTTTVKTFDTNPVAPPKKP